MHVTPKNSVLPVAKKISKKIIFTLSTLMTIDTVSLSLTLVPTPLFRTSPIYIKHQHKLETILQILSIINITLFVGQLDLELPILTTFFLKRSPQNLLNCNMVSLITMEIYAQNILECQLQNIVFV